MNPNAARILNLRQKPGFLLAAAAAIATAKTGKQFDEKDIQKPANNLIAATSTRDFNGIDRVVHRVMQTRGLESTPQNYQLVLNDVATGKISPKERYVGVIAFEGDSSSIHTATGGITKVKPEIPLFQLVEYKDPNVNFDTGAWERHPRFTKLGAKMTKVAEGLVPVVPQYLS